MAVNGRKRTRRGRRRRRQAIIGGTLRLRNETPVASAPDAAEGPHHAGILRPDSEEWRLPEALAEAGEADSNSFRPGRVMSAITILAIVFIAIMTWFVSQMPEK
ncbi:MAG: hypothetical protein J2P52_03485 [Blastocatellia bacterium]|nr:hypothetical protein [Blastocatellia bacterium]